MPLSQQKKGAIAWGIYDWANSSFPTVITTFVFAAYFTQSVAKDNIIGTHQWANAMALAGLIIALLSPILGSAASYLGQKKRWIGLFTLLCVASCSLLWFAKPENTYVYWTLTWVVIGTIGFEMGTVFYNAMMRDLIPQSHLGRLSGWSFGLGYFGGLCCLGTALFLIQSGPNLSWLPLNASTSENIRAAGPLVAIWFGLFSLPFFIMTPDHEARLMEPKAAFTQGFKDLIETFKNTRENKQMLLFLLAHMIYMDGLNTMFVFGGIYAAGTFGLQPSELIIFGIAMNITAGLGAISFGWIDDFLGSKKTILLALGGLIFCCVGLLTTYSLTIFWYLAILLGLFVGPVQAASRSLLTRLARPEDLTKLFGLYACSGKITAFVGPWILGMATYAFASQRAGMTTIIVFFLVGGGILMMVRGSKG